MLLFRFNSINTIIWEKRATIKNNFLRPVLSLILPKNHEKTPIPTPIHISVNIISQSENPFELKYTGKNALGKLKVFVGTPSFLKESETIHFSDADASKFNCKRIFVGELARRIGSYRSRPLTVDKKVL